MICLRSLFFLFLFTCYLFSCPGLSLSQDGYAFINAWGSLGTGDGQFNDPTGIAVDSSGNVYVSDFYNNRIQKFSSTGNYITQWGSLGTGNGQLYGPIGVAVDSSGNVYVTEFYNNRIQKFSSTGSYITQWGSLGTGSGQFNYPFGVATDSSGYVYVADTFNSRIQKFSSTGTYITQWGYQGSGNGQFYGPVGVVADSAGKVYVVDLGNYRIQKFSSVGSYITQWGSSGSGNGQFSSPACVAVDSLGNVYVTDLDYNRIQKFSSTGTYITQWGSSGSGNGQFNSADGVALDSSGNVYVLDEDNNRIQKFAPSCGCSLSPPTYAYSSQSATGTVTVTTYPSGCTWTAASNDSWIYITSGSSGTGDGTVSYYVDVNTTGIARKGTIVIGVEAFTIRQAAGTFYDDPNDMFTPHIYAISTEGITKGCWGDPNYFCPSDVVTRGAMAAFIIRAKYGEDFSYTQTPYFFDVPPSNGYFKYVQMMRDEGITQGCWGDPNYYCPDDVVTRGAMAAFIIRALYGEDFSYTQTPYFTDVPPSNGYFKYVQKMKDEGITGNVGTYNWTDVVIREHMAAFLARAFLGMALTTSGYGDNTPPSTPTGLTANASSSLINLSWNASTDNVGVAGYKIYRAGLYLMSTTGTLTSDMGLSAGTLYCYKVSAYDAANNESSQSAEFCTTTSPIATSNNFVNLQSDPGDFIGQGHNYNYTNANAQITVSATGGHLSVSIHGNEWWYGDFQVPSGFSQLQQGYYGNLQSYPSYSPGLTWYGEGRGSNATGWFAIDKVTYVKGVLTEIYLRFEQHSEGATPALHGQIYWSSRDTTVPPGPINPPPAGLWKPVAGSTPSNGNYVYLQSDYGDYIGIGQTYIYTNSIAQISVTASGGHLAVSINSGQDWWQGDFQTMSNLNQLQPGYYGNLMRYPFNNPTRGGLNWSGNGRGSNTLSGWFVVDNVTYANGTLSSIDLRFEQHSEGITPALHGQIHWIQ